MPTVSRSAWRAAAGVDKRADRDSTDATARGARPPGAAEAPRAPPTNAGGSPPAAGAVVEDEPGNRQTECDQAKECRGHPSIALERDVIFALLGPRMPRRDGVVRQQRDELLDRLFRIEADLDRVGPHEGAAENAARQARDVVAFERFRARPTEIFVALAI